jgi:hypothetical protein
MKWNIRISIMLGIHDVGHGKTLLLEDEGGVNQQESARRFPARLERLRLVPG